jgi:dTDP-4-dehydrorhamnose reductase
VTPLARADLDITHTAAVRHAVEAVRPDVLINCVAYNDVDGAEDEPVPAFSVNAFAVQALAHAAAQAGAIFVHYSTDFVFDGNTDRPYTEEDRPDPLSVYGASKLVGEWLAREAPRHYTLRVESLFGGDTSGQGVRPGSVGMILGHIEAGRDVPVFTDRVVSPTYAPDAAAATRQMVTDLLPFGLYHCVNTGACRWDELAAEAARVLGQEVTFKALTLDSLTLKARRPRYCALSNAKLAAAGVQMSHWRDALRAYVASRVN